MAGEFASAQALRYAEELSGLYADEQAQRLRAERALLEIEMSYRATVRALAVALELRDDATGRHAERVATLALDIARIVAPELAGDAETEFGFLLHDVGKIGIPDAILQKPGPLTPAERQAMQEHPRLGQRIIGMLPHLGGAARDVVVHHHERWDGEGYPLGLTGDDIPLAARIFAIADAWDAMTNDRPYRTALSEEDALAEIDEHSGRQFDPRLSGAFLAHARAPV